jgi:phosphoglycerate kinase
MKYFLKFATLKRFRKNNTSIKYILEMTIDQYNFNGKKAIVRVDFNVPLDENGKITDDTRIRGALPTLKKILADGGSLIIMSHMGKPKGKVNPKMSLSQIKDTVAKYLGTEVEFAEDCAKAAQQAAELKPGQVLLLENLRFHPEEEGKPVGIDKEDPAYDAAKKEMKERQKEFAKTLASYADVYVNDAFGTAHRRHASTAVIADYFDKDSKMLGYLMEKEVNAVDAILKDIKRPFTAIMGGSKVSTKIGIIENLMDKVDNLILCGGMTYTFAAAKGGKVGKSICETDKFDLALDIIKKAEEKGVNLVLGTDCVAADDFSNDANTMVVSCMDVPAEWEGVDAGPVTREMFADAIRNAKTILWNGPAGVFEFDNFAGGSRAIADAIVEATEKGAFSLVGGGDSVACINKFGLADKVSYVSTGGGALLEAIEGKELPGIAAIRGSEK